MDTITLTVSPRSTDQRAAVLRRQKLIPMEIYGHGFDNQHVQVDYQTFRRTFEKATYSTIMHVTVEGAKDAVPVLVQDVQYHPVTDEITHVDLHAIRMDEKVQTHISLSFVGDSEAIKQGALLSTLKHQLEVSCLPGDLVHEIEVDLSALAEVGDVIRVGDLTIPKGLEVFDTDEEPIVTAVEPRVVEETEAEEEAGAEEGAEGEEGAEKTEGDGEKEE